MAGWTDLPSLRRRWRTLPGEPEEGFEKASEAGGVEMQGLQKAIHGDGGNRSSRQQDPAEQVDDSHHLMGGSAKELNARQLHMRLGLTYKSARFLVKRLGEEVRQGALGKKRNWLLEAEGAHVVGKSSRKRRFRAKKRTTLLYVAEGKGSSGPGVLEQLKIKSLKGFAKRTWRRLSGV